MSTRGLYGFRKNGVDKLTYNHSDSYPNGLGWSVVKFIKAHSPEQLNTLYDRIVLVKEDQKPTPEQKTFCVRAGLYNETASTRSTDDWYCLLRNLQGNMDEYSRLLAVEDIPIYMIDSHEFIKDSLFCEYAYIVNLDDNILEFYIGFQERPDENNRYGADSDEGYYPCKLVRSFPFEDIIRSQSNKLVEEMESAEQTDGDDQGNKGQDDMLTIEEREEVGDRTVSAVWEGIDEAAENEARSLGYLTDENSRWFDIKAFGEDMLDEHMYKELSTGRVVYFQR